MALRNRLESARSATTRLSEVLDLAEPDDLIRDAAILRFEMASEAAWKAVQEFLRHRHGLDVASPRAVWRAARDVELISDEEAELVMEMTSDRNLVIHLYDEALANQVFARLPRYRRLLEAILRRDALSARGPRD